MADTRLMDQAFQRIMRGLVDTGRAPHYAVRGEQRWFAQCGFEATSTTWLFPGQTVRVDAPCLDCGDPVSVEMRDGRITWVDPPGVVGHLAFGFGPSRGRPHYL